jgi:choice-of-anchor C domain-containing protein
MKSYILAAALVAVPFIQSASAATTITNGSFESTPVTNPDQSFDTLGGSSVLAGWTVDGSIDLIRNYWQASDGSQSLDMNGFFAAGSIWQTVSGLVVGHAYNIFFDLSGNPDSGPTEKALRVSMGGSKDYKYDIAAHGTSHGNMHWATQVFRFTASSTEQVLTFASINDPNGAWGPALDNVSISEVPVPAGAPLLIGGIAALGALRRRRRSV